MTCPRVLDDGSYLLGALPSEDRRAYEEHLGKCAQCTAALGELAGLPGLLSRLPAGAVETPEPLPATVLPALLTAVDLERRRSRRRIRHAAAALVAAAAVVVSVLLVPRVIGPPPPARTSLARVLDVPIDASAALVDKAWGTEVSLRCSYTASMKHAPPIYLLVAKDRSGHPQQIATWAVVSGRPVALTAATSLHRQELAALEIQAPDGTPLLRLKR